MANHYFKFKQFIIHQDRCAMKVCTDACLFGAWVASQLDNSTGSYDNEISSLERKTILDIGSGTGLLILMLAQKIPAHFTGIEIEAECFIQLEENIRQTNWKQSIQLINGDIRNFTSGKPFDFILSNPPFFENDLNSASGEQQLAKHSKELKLEELLESIERNLSTHGSFSVLLPYHRVDYFENLANRKGFFLTQKMLVRQSDKHGFFRVMLTFIRNFNEFNSKEMSIKINNEYSPEFITLLKDYYLYL